MKPQITIIILNWNGWIDTIECMESIFQISYPNFSIVLIDNGSTDESVKKIKEYCAGQIEIRSKFFEYDPNNKPFDVIVQTKDEIEQGITNKVSEIRPDKKIILIVNDKNDGFAEGNNIGIKYSIKILNPDYLLLLNNDTVVSPDFLDKLVDFAIKNPRAGMIGPKVLYYDDATLINSAGVKFHWWTGLGINRGIGRIEQEKYNKTKEVDCLLGCAILIKRSVIEEIGLLDKDFFMMLEETDFCLRAKKKGYKIYYNPEAKVFHKEAASLQKVSGTRLYFLHRNRVLIARKNYSSFIKIVAFPIIMLRGAIAIFYYILKLKPNDARIICKAYHDAFLEKNSRNISIDQYSSLIQNRKNEI
jgi:GT2 family glycosyltransferase